MHPNLSFEQAPPISVPYRFFLTAPWLGVLAGLLLAWQGGDMLALRWMPATLAATHLMVAGFMLQAMCGAVLQFVPVATGGNIWRPRLIAGIAHPLILLAVLLLASAFMRQTPGLFVAAAYSFMAGSGLFVVATGIGLWRTPAQGATLFALRIALLALLITVSLGATLAFGLAYGLDLPLPILTDIHAGWGLGGWSLILLAGVSYFVVPMFQLTPAYPNWLTRTLPLALIVFLGLWSLQLPGLDETVRRLILLGGAVMVGIYAVETLRLQRRRRRKVGDVTLSFFRLAMISALLVVASIVAYVLFPALADDSRTPVWFGLLMVVGVFVSAINGMLYKIVPFLNWMHLQRIAGLGKPPPNMKQMIAEGQMRGQYRLHLAALGLLLLAVWIPLLARPAGLAMAVSCGWLGINLAKAVYIFRQFKDRIHANA